MIYAWKNNEKRLTMYGRQCRVLKTGAKNSVLIEFRDNGQREIVSRRALREQKRINQMQIWEKK